MHHKWKVYLSSTYMDLHELRAELEHYFYAQLKDKFELTRVMEYMYDNGNNKNFETDCIDEVKKCDIYILILGNSVGSYPPNETRTYTEIELDTALEYSKKIYCFQLAEFNETEIRDKTKHNEILAKFRGKPTHYFSDLTSVKNEFLSCLFPYAHVSPVIQKSPYKGLAAFNVEDGNYFFGRKEEIDGCIKNMVLNKINNKNNFIAVIGNSGIGKTSFVQAGLMHQLLQHKDFSSYKQIIFSIASQPYSNLQFSLNENGLTVNDLLAENNNHAVILFFNQFEEIITQCNTDEAALERTALFNFLDKIALKTDKHNVVIITTFRSDYISQLSNFGFISTQQFTALKSFEYGLNISNWEKSLTEIIQVPALKNGVTIENALTNKILKEIQEIDGHLPILQLTLDKLWTNETIEDRIITSTEYDNLAEGEGIKGIIQKHADTVFKNITDNNSNKEKAEVFKTIMLNLVEVTESKMDVRYTMKKGDLLNTLYQNHPQEMVNEVYNYLIGTDSRLLVETEINNATHVDIIHEVLIRKWEKLKEWINNKREAILYKKKIEEDARNYEKGDGEYYKGKRLKTALSWSEGNKELQNENINRFIRVGMKKRKQQFAICVYFFGIVFLCIGSYYAYMQSDYKFKQDLLDNDNTKYIIEEAGGDFKNITNLSINEKTAEIVGSRIHKFTNLTSLRISIKSENGKKIKNLEDLHFIKENIKVDTLIITSDGKYFNLHGIEKLLNLKYIDIQGIADSNLVEHIREIKSIEGLSFSDCWLLDLGAINDSKYLNNITFLQLKGIQEIKKIENISKLISLKQLYLNLKHNSIQLKDIASLNNLEKLNLSNIENLKNLNPISTLKKLNYLTLTNNINLNSIEGVEKIHTLKTLHLYYNPTLSKIKNVNLCKNLEDFIISGCSDSLNFTELGNNKYIKYLEMNYNTSLKSFNFLNKFHSLKYLEIVGNKNLLNIYGIDSLKNLETLRILDNKQMKLINSFGGLAKLENLYLGDIDKIDLSFLANLHELKTVYLNKIKNNYNFEILKNCELLNTLIISNNKYIKDFTRFKNIEKIKYLNISNCEKLETFVINTKDLNLNQISFISNKNLKELTYLSLWENSKIKNYNFLNGLEKLRNLEINNSDTIKTVPNFSSLKKLEELEYINSKYNEEEFLNQINGMTALKHLLIDNSKSLKYAKLNDIKSGIKLSYR
jgi:Domain of unknown function (DUF4062)